MNIHQYITSAQIPVPANEYEKALIENCICMNGEKTDPDYHSAVLIPVKRK